ncbi:MAG: RES family NAD+ phosphorylase [Candidatus Scalindua sp.]|jgi:hypothetical protein|nr:RES family NAD+ phosphorylase [Candidatus Scalindua sp.]MBT5304344.1 RES family NAD+ phosphorylase [Candidatus Scalindua sp.]MBT6053224.1 RES family NAD+ phosphorylase [Candidatus Scalindua sp.]MBT6227073.1 RES family NAD+ phosphorylase [Candidatus Scalindua sp.]MBT7213288.1 RES family NAD+ phosphorylase [Candidatus Scalindua sp.]
MNSCGNCFSDRFISNHIDNSANKKRGKCDFCDKNDVNLIELVELSDVFQQVIDIYTIDENGVQLVDLLKKDWHLFEKLDNEKSTILLCEIFPETDFINIKYSPKIEIDPSRIVQWDKFRDELIRKNRFFSESIPDRKHLENLFSNILLKDDDYSKELYRARISIGSKPFPIDQMGKPPESNVSEGRANPVGIPYLYTATDPKTAIEEIRPHKGEYVSIAKFVVINDLKLVDLRNPRKTISPFSLSEDGLSQLYSDMEYLCSLGEELSKPVVPRHARLEYLPSQYLCELIKNNGFDGVVYKSSVGSGDNYAIFNDEKLNGIDVEQYEVSETRIEVKKDGIH